MKEKQKHGIRTIIIAGDVVFAVLLLGSVLFDHVQWGMAILKYLYLWLAVTVVLDGVVVFGEWKTLSMKKRSKAAVVLCVEVICLCIACFLARQMFQI